MSESWPPAIADHAVLADGHSAALVAKDGTVDWLCWPRFDGPACFAALLGTRPHGQWRIGPQRHGFAVRRAYQAGTLVLETLFASAEGAVAVIDFMTADAAGSHLVRLVEGRGGAVAMRADFAPRFHDGSAAPVFARQGAAVVASCGADAVTLRADIAEWDRDGEIVSEWLLQEGDRTAFVLSYGREAAAFDAWRRLEETEAWWRGWSGGGTYRGPHAAPVRQSLMALKALTHVSGGMVAAPTTSLPEWPGGARNWDYRFCWLRDSALCASAFVEGGHVADAVAWRDWLVRTLADGAPRPLYRVDGTAAPEEREADWLPGYGGARPVRLGNAAKAQLQIDVHGEIALALHRLRLAVPEEAEAAWALQRRLTDALVPLLREPDEGIWEVRGKRRHFVHSKVMAWTALDRALADAESFGLAAPVVRWRAARDGLKAEILAQGFDAGRGSFVQSYGAGLLDASLLMIPALGFLPPDDSRVQGTVDAIMRDLMRGGLVMRYDSAAGADGLPEGEGAFLACSFWLVEALARIGRRDEANALFERLLDLRNDVGLLAEEVDPATGAMLGNFPQGLSHAGLVSAAAALSG